MEPTLPIPNRVLKRRRANDTYFIGKVGSRQIKVSENMSRKNTHRTAKQTKVDAGADTETAADVKYIALAFADFLDQREFGLDTLHELVDEIYETDPEIDKDPFWDELHEEFGAAIVAGLIIDTLADILQENFNVHFNGTDLAFENTGDIINFLITEPGRICVNLSEQTTVGDIFELFTRVTKETFGEQDLYDSGINIYNLVQEGMENIVAEAGVNLDQVLGGGKIEDFIDEYIIPVLENAGATAFLMYQTDDNLQGENHPESNESR